MKTMLPFAALAALVVATSPVAAEPRANSYTVAVSYADLDLNSRGGIARLDRRIRAAVETACGTTSDFDVRGKNAVQRCHAETLAAVAAQRDQAIRTAQRASQVRLASQ